MLIYGRSAFAILVTSHCSAVPHEAQVTLSLGLIIIFREGYSIRPQQGFYEALGCGSDLCLPAVSTSAWRFVFEVTGVSLLSLETKDHYAVSLEGPHRADRLWIGKLFNFIKATYLTYYDIMQ